MLNNLPTWLVQFHKLQEIKLNKSKKLFTSAHFEKRRNINIKFQAHQELGSVFFLKIC
jgi:hypothetical protein